MKQNPIQPFLLKLRMVHRTALCNATVDDIPIYFSWYPNLLQENTYYIPLLDLSISAMITICIIYKNILERSEKSITKYENRFSLPTHTSARTATIKKGCLYSCDAVTRAPW